MDFTMAKRRTRKLSARTLARYKALGSALPAACPRPTYGRTLAGSLVGDLTQLIFIGAGAGAGAMIARGMGASPQGTMLAVVGGGVVGGLGGIYPSLAADRAILRGSDCPNASLGRLFGARLAKGAVISAAVMGARAIEPKHAPKIVSAIGAFAAVPLTQAIIRT